MDLVFIAIVLMITVFGWRALSNPSEGAGSCRVSCSRCLQKCLHCFGPITPFFQWYGILFVALCALILRTFWDICTFEYFKFHFLTTGIFIDEPGFLPESVTQEEKAQLHMGPGLKFFSLSAPVAGALAAGVVCEHVAKFVLANKRARAAKGESLAWQMSGEANIILLVIAMPIFFILMSMRAELRMWAVMTGSAWLPYHGQENPSKPWEVVKTLETSTYTNDLELASCFQFLTIWVFGQLCVNYLKDAPAAYRSALKWAGLQGVYLYVIFGILRSLGAFAEALAKQHPQYEVQASLVQAKALTIVSPVFTVATVLCVYNMVILGGMDDIKKKLGSVNMKFQATRALLLVSQIQMQVLMAFVVGGATYQSLQKAPPQAQRLVHMVNSWDLSEYRAKLIHAALLNFECLAVVLWNRFVWKAECYDYDYQEQQGNVVQAREFLGDVKEPLLQAVE